MKISHLQENLTPASAPSAPTPGPKFGRSDEMLESGASTTTAGVMSTGTPTNMGVQRRSKKGSDLLKGIKISEKYANSRKAGISEDAINEDDLSEEQLQAKKRREELFKRSKPRDIGNKPSDREIMAKEEFNGGGEYNDEIDMVQNNLHTIVRVSTHLGKELQADENLPEWVQEKIAVCKSMIVTVMDYMISQHERGNVYTQDMDEGQLEFNTPDPVIVVQDLKGNILDTVNLSVAAQKYKLGQPQNIKNQLAHQSYTKIGNYTISAPMGGQPQDKTTTGQKNTFATGMAEGAKVDRMVKHVKSSEKKLGHSDKEAENIAWATANKRGMLDNKNKKNVAEGMGGQVVFSGTGDNGGKYEIIQSGDDFMIHANGKHIDSYGSLHRAMSVLKNEVPGLKKTVDEESKGLWANIHAKRERIKHGSGEHMRKPGSKGAPTADALRKSAK